MNNAIYRCGIVPKYSVMDGDMTEIMNITGPCCVCPCSDVEFNVSTHITD